VDVGRTAEVQVIRVRSACAGLNLVVCVMIPARADTAELPTFATFWGNINAVQPWVDIHICGRVRVQRCRKGVECHDLQTIHEGNICSDFVVYTQREHCLHLQCSTVD
jgi:hypothetical protein